MKRITKYEPSKDSMFPYKLVDNELSTELDAIHQLGRFEDLMEEYNINSIQELENTLSSKFIEGGSRSGGKSIVAKGMLYNKLSEEFGCPLVVVFKALKDGIVYEKENKYVLIPNLIFAQLLNEDVDDYHFINYDLPNLENNLIVKLSDYQKTWWLKGEEIGK